jgi:hypothetical protein
MLRLGPTDKWILEQTPQEPYQDSPSPMRSPESTDPATRALTAKPLPALPLDVTHEALEPYRDDPTSPSEDEEASPRPTPSTNTPSADGQIPHTPYTDNFENDDDVPLAYLYRYPTEAPPSYMSVVRESYRATLIEHIPMYSTTSDVDEEAGIDWNSADEDRFKVERVAAAVVVCMMLLVLTALLTFIALNYAHSLP